MVPLSIKVDCEKTTKGLMHAAKVQVVQVHLDSLYEVMKYYKHDGAPQMKE
jgi:hypothetical protein